MTVGQTNAVFLPRPVFGTLSPWGVLGGSYGILPPGVGGAILGQNVAFYIPFWVPVPTPIAKLAILNAGTVAGNVCMGLYDANFVQLYTSGSVAMAGASSHQLFTSVNQTVAGRFYVGFASNSATGNHNRYSVATNAPGLLAGEVGVYTEASAFPLPTTPTPATPTVDTVPRVLCITSTVPVLT